MADISKRLLDQRLRSAMAERLLMLVDWRETLRMGASEYFNAFYDAFPDHSPLEPNSALTQDERDALQLVTELVGQAAADTSQNVTAEELIASGWPERICPAAENAMQLMELRGRFSDIEEEDKPSQVFKR